MEYNESRRARIKIFCDSSIKEACIVVEGQKPIFIAYPSPVTNNVGEYTAVLLALQWVLNNLTDPPVRREPITIHTDSLLVVNQVSGVWACRKHHLLPFKRKVNELMQKIMNGGRDIRLEWIPREENLAGIELERLEGVDN